MTIRLRHLLLSALFLIVIAVIAAGLFGILRHRQFNNQPRPSDIVSDAPGANALVAPVIGDMQAVINDVSPEWNLTLSRSDSELLAALAHRYPALPKRFTGGVDLTLLDGRTAPEPLRGPYDEHDDLLRFAAFWPNPEPGQVVIPEMEAWADCRRDLELGPARTLHCYLYVEGEPGETLDGLAVLAWVQALDYVMAGYAQAPDPATIPLLTATKQAEQWTYTDAYLSLSPSP